jgi:hypothetical protein
MTSSRTSAATTIRNNGALRAIWLGRLLCGALLGATLLAGCSPSLDWREVRVADGQVAALFPCRPESRVRLVLLAGVKLEMHLESCTAGEANFALSHVNVGDPTRVEPVLRQLQAVFASNVGGTLAEAGPAKVPGMTPNPLASRVRVTGAREDGSAITAEAVFFVCGTVIYQATMLGGRLDAETADTFFAALSAS